MLVHIQHRTEYQYSEPVYLEPFTLQLKPRTDAFQVVTQYQTKITPQPEGCSNGVGLDGNHIETIWFGGLHQHLIIETDCIVETHAFNPFNFYITDANALKLPLSLSNITRLSSYLKRNQDATIVADFTNTVLASSNHDTITFLTQLAAAVYSTLKYTIRPFGDAWLPQETLHQGCGSCRDFAMLYIDVCRSVGIPARFVSGYCVSDAATSSDMHAWVEVYLTGAGWRGFDPTRGSATSSEYIAVATSDYPQGAMPTEGSYRGQAQSTLTANIHIDILNQ